MRENMNRMGKTRAFLVEFILVILFFSISAVITLQLFVAANEKSTLSSEKTAAYLKMQTMAEEIKGKGTYFESYFSAANGWKDFTRYYDREFNISDVETASYVLRAELKQTEHTGGELAAVVLTFYKIKAGQEEEICSLQVQSYLPDWEK